MFRRYLKLEADSVEEYVEFLKKHGMWNEAATLRKCTLLNPTVRLCCHLHVDQST